MCAPPLPGMSFPLAGLIIHSDSDFRSVVADTTYVHYEKTIDMLNKTMGLCLPLR